MRAALPWLVLIALYWLAAAAQPSVAPHLTVFGAMPDFLLVTMMAVSLVSRPGGGAVAGFAAGVLAGATAGANLTHYVISRTITGFALGFVDRAEVKVTLGLAALLTALGTVVSQLLLMFLAPPSEIGPYLAATMGTALYNGVLALPVFAVLRRLFRPKVV